MGISRDALPGQRTESGPRRTCGFWDAEEGKDAKWFKKLKTERRRRRREKGKEGKGKEKEERLTIVI